MTHLRFNRLRIEVTTTAGLYGVDLDFANGLNIVRANNTRGKSTCFNSALYALGMDAIFTARRSLPLPPVLTSRLYADDLESEVAVSNARIFLEIEGIGGTATVERQLTADESRVIRVFEGSQLRQVLNGNRPYADLFIRRSGAATSDLGFHSWLNGFIGWKLPEVEKFDGTQSQLYAETIFPLFFVEQRFGWSRLQGNTPLYFGIRDVTRRAAEFVLSLSFSESQLRRNTLSQRLRSLQLRYSEAYKSIQGLLEYEGATLRGIPDSLPLATDGFSPLVLLFREDRWVSLADRTTQLDDLLKAVQLKEQRPPSLGPIGERAEQIAAALSETTMAERQQRQEQSALKKRIAAVSEDLRKLTDTAVLAELGGTIRQDQVFATCPTCQQPIADHISPDLKPSDLLPIHQTIELLKDELSVLQATLRESILTCRGLEAKRQELEQELSRAERLESAPRDPEGLIATALQTAELRSESAKLKRFDDRLQAQLLSLSAIVAEARKVKTALDIVPVRLTDNDRTRIRTLEEAFREQERQYEFDSFPINAIGISDETYKPTVDGFEMSFETSASDAIRTIWAYLLALLEINRSYSDMNHIGLLSFDEPKQQSAKRFSFGQLLRRASLAGHYKQQVIFFTSEDEGEVRTALDGTNYHLRTFQDRMIARLET